MAGANILGVMVGDFRHGKKPCPIILLKVEKSSEVDFYGTILPFGQSVHLRIESGGKSLLDA